MRLYSIALQQLLSVWESACNLSSKSAPWQLSMLKVGEGVSNEVTGVNNSKYAKNGQRPSKVAKSVKQGSMIVVYEDQR